MANAPCIVPAAAAAAAAAAGGGGGTCCCVVFRAGSHHANFPLPVRVASCEENLGLVHHLQFKAGDVLLFADGALCHGTLPWRSPTPRRAMLAK